MTRFSRLNHKILYNLALLPAGWALANLLSPFHGKLKSTVTARRGLKKRWKEKSKHIQGSPIWFHVSSVGEFEQAMPVIEALSDKYPNLPVAVTFLSPSGYTYAAKKLKTESIGNIKFLEYLPFDFSWNASFCLALLRPRVLVFVKFDLWPNLIWNAKERGIPIMLIDATLSESSYRFSRTGRSFYRAIYESIDRILAISSSDAERFKESVPGHSGISVIGDTRFDRVAQRKKKSMDIPMKNDGKILLLAGSTWPPDEERILPAFERLLGEIPELNIIIAPHEPTRERVEKLMSWGQDHSFAARRFSEIQEGAQDRIVVVDGVGILAELYRVADIVYVGGSFSSGVHNVIEPAIMGVPVLFGPIHKNSFEALELLKRGGAIEVRDSKSTYEALNHLIKDHKARISMGGKAKEYVQSQLGATQACLEILSTYVSPSGNKY